MTERRSIQVEISYPDSMNDLDPININLLIRDLIAVRDSVPEKHREDVVVEIESNDGYMGVCTSIYYWRPETDEEVESRKIRDDAYFDKIKLKDLATIKRLQEKYKDES